jgi:hypothetical protein
MVALDEGQQVLHWRDGAWHRIAWQDWMNFRELRGAFAPLPYVTAGEHRFVVCIVEDGRLYNIIPHRYLIDRDGRIADDCYFGVLSDGEIERYRALNKRHYEYPEAHPLNDEERREFDAIRDRLWRSWLPPVEAVRELTRAAVALPDENDAAWNVLEACGISRGVSGRSSKKFRAAMKLRRRVHTQMLAGTPAGLLRQPCARDTIRTPISVSPAISIGYIEAHIPTRGEGRKRRRHTVNRIPSWPVTVSARTAPGVSPAIATGRKCSVRPRVALSIRT